MKDNVYIGNKCYMIFNDEDDAIYWCDLFNLIWPDIVICCCGGYYNAVELTTK